MATRGFEDMGACRSLAASFHISALLFGLTLVVPAHGQDRGSARTDPSSGGGAAPQSGIDIALPELPTATVTISPSDLTPGIATKAAAARIVADPGSLLKAYAPLHRKPNVADLPIMRAVPAAQQAPSAIPPIALAGASSSDPIVPAKVAPALPQTSAVASVDGTATARGDALPTTPPAPTASSPPKPADADASATTGSVGPALADTPPAAPPRAVPAPSASAPAPAQPTREPPVAAATPAVLDAATLHNVLDAYVGPEPVKVPGPAYAQLEGLFKHRQAIAAVYAARNFAPFWIGDGKFNDKARSAMARVDHASEDGLNLRSFAIPIPRGDAAALAASELALTEAVAAYGNQASGGRVDPSRLAALIAAKPDVADPARVLGTVAEAADPGEALRAFNPPQKGYAALRDKLAELRQHTDVAGHDPIPYGPTLKPGMRDARVPLIRARFGLDLPSSDTEEVGLVYDTRVAAAVADFQRAHHLPASGVLTIRTIAALSGGNPVRLENEILANMERWRWLPRDMGENHVEVNIPDFTLKVMHGDTVFHHARVVVGQPDKPTPVFSENLQFIIVNPYWNVPLSIVKKEMMPKLAVNPDYFADHGYEVVERNGITYVRQPPGEANALGRIKFMFPNKYSVYLHDTNARSLFGNDRRALSHGCVRVDQPFKLAEAVLGRENGWTEARVKKMVGGNERTINLPQPLPLHIVYFTAFVDETGSLKLRDDVYGYSAKLKAALGLEG